MSGRSELEELRARKKTQFVKLLEVSDATKRMAEAVDRRDEVSANLLLAERERPLLELTELEESIRAYLLTLPEERAVRAGELLNGAAAEAEEELPLAEQVAQYRRLLSSTQDRDRELSLRLGGSRSLYRKFRES